MTGRSQNGVHSRPSGGNPRSSNPRSSGAWRMLQARRWPAALAGLAVVLIFGLYAWSLAVERDFVSGPAGIASAPPILTEGEPFDVPEEARVLIEKIKQATREARDGEGEEESDFEEWHRRNPCRSREGLRAMYEQRQYARKVPPNPVWEEVLREYTKLHRACIRKVGNLTELFLSGNESAGCKFVVTDVTPLSGLGNKILVTISSVLYSILTQRVILVATNNLVPTYTCEPFPGSTWTLDGNEFPLPAGNYTDSDPWEEDRTYFRTIDRIIRKGNRTSGPDLRLPHAVTAVQKWGWQPNARFYCTTEQEFYSRVMWVHFTGCIYALPKLFTAPTFRPTLEALFPDRLASTWLLRSLVLPSDAVWDRILRIDRTYLQGADRRVGIQIRYKDGKEMYWRMNKLINERVTDCVIRNHILPNVSGVLWDRGQEPTASTKVIKVFIASLFSGLQDHLARMYVQSPTVTGETVGFVQVSQGGSQQWSKEEDMQAFTEILLLSFSDHLLVTPVSTFGGLAEAYGGLTPWYVEYRERFSGPSCQRAQTVDVCNQFTFKKYSCPYEPQIHRRPFTEVVPYIKDCLAIDHGEGIQLISDFVS